MSGSSIEFLQQIQAYGTLISAVAVVLSCIIILFQKKIESEFHGRRWITKLKQIESVNKYLSIFEDSSITMVLGMFLPIVILYTINFMFKNNIYVLISMFILILYPLLFTIFIIKLKKNLESILESINIKFENLKKNLEKFLIIYEFLKGATLWSLIITLSVWITYLQYYYQQNFILIIMLISTTIILFYVFLYLIKFGKIIYYLKYKIIEKGIKEKIIPKLPTIKIYTDSKDFEGEIIKIEKDFITLEINAKCVVIPWENIKAIGLDKFTIFRERKDKR